MVPEADTLQVWVDVLEAEQYVQYTVVVGGGGRVRGVGRILHVW
jgi:hypothetical protein